MSAASLPRLFAIACAAALGAAHAGDAAVDRYAPLRMEAGRWAADITFFEADQPNGRARGIQTNTLLANGHWVVNDFQVQGTDGRPTYQGHGVWGWDPVAQTYVNTWVDTNDRTVRTDYGYWHAPQQTMAWSSKQSDGHGHFVDYRMTEEFKGDERIFSVYVLGMVTPNAHPVLRIVFTRVAAEPGDASVR